MKLLVRLDDITPDMEWRKFLQLKKLLDKYNVKPLIGIVPDNIDELLSFNHKRNDFWEYCKLLEAEGWTLAMHGYQHRYISNKIQSEFLGLSYDTQLTMLKSGLKILNEHGIKTRVFFAPSHSYDENTIKAVKALGFGYISDGFSRTVYEKSGMIFIPVSKNINRISHYISSKEGLTTLVLHSNNIDESLFDRVEKILDKASKKNCLLPYSEALNWEPAEFDSKWNNRELKIEALIIKLAKIKKVIKMRIKGEQYECK